MPRLPDSVWYRYTTVYCCRAPATGALLYQIETMKDTGKPKPAANGLFIAVKQTGFTANESVPSPEGTNPSPEETDAFPRETKPAPEGTMGEASLPSPHPGKRRGEAPVSPAPPKGTPGERFVIKGETFDSIAYPEERPGENFKTKEEAFERKVEDFVVSGQGFKTKVEGALPFASFRRTKEEGNGRKGVAGRRMAAYSQSSVITFVTRAAAIDPNHLLPRVRAPTRAFHARIPASRMNVGSRDEEEQNFLLRHSAITNILN